MKNPARHPRAWHALRRRRDNLGNLDILTPYIADESGGLVYLDPPVSATARSMTTDRRRTLSGRINLGLLASFSARGILPSVFSIF